MHIHLPTSFNVATHFIDRHVREGRERKIAFECGDEQISYGQLLERVNRLGNALAKLHVRPEERVALLLLDTPEFAYAFFSAIKIGAVAVPMNTMLQPPEWEYMLNDCRARVVIVNESLLPQLQSIPPTSLPYLKSIIVAGNAPKDCVSLRQLLDENSGEL